MLQHIENKTKEKIPKIPFGEIAEFALPQGYELSLAFVTSADSKRFNKQYRNKDKPTNILSFPLSESLGEILIDPKIARAEADLQKEKFETYLTYLFIHGLTHLKGFDHGSRMDKEERKIRNKFKNIFGLSKLL